LKGGGPSSTSDQFTSVVTTLNLTTGQTTELASSQGVALAGGWSSDGSIVAYFTDSGGIHHYWLKRGSAALAEFSTPVKSWEEVEARTTRAWSPFRTTASMFSWSTQP